MNEKNKVPLKKIGFERRVGNISKKGEGVLTRKRCRKNKGDGCGPQRIILIIVTDFVAKKVKSFE